MSRVLLVDDDTAGLELRVLIFERQGHTISAACNVDRARTQFAEFRPEIVVLDLRLPDAEDGLALIREFREGAPNLRIVVLSGWTLDLAGRAEADMVDEILAKPTKTARLLQAISTPLA